MVRIDPAATTLSADEIRRYSRHLVLPEVGLEGQQAIKAARVLCVGAGGLGSPVSMYFAAAGVGTLGIIDDDVVDVSNLQRQILHMTCDVGRPKTESARERLTGINPGIRVETHASALSSANAVALVSRTTSSWWVRQLPDALPRQRCLRPDAQPSSTARSSASKDRPACSRPSGGPCYRCLYAEPPPARPRSELRRGGRTRRRPRHHRHLPGDGSHEANPQHRRTPHRQDPDPGRARNDVPQDRLKRNPKCPVCGIPPTSRKLKDYEQFCGATIPSQAVESAEAADFDVSPDMVLRRRCSCRTGRASRTCKACVRHVTSST